MGLGALGCVGHLPSLPWGGATPAARVATDARSASETATASADARNALEAVADLNRLATEVTATAFRC